jgi:hypothetical protein
LIGGIVVAAVVIIGVILAIRPGPTPPTTVDTTTTLPSSTTTLPASTTTLPSPDPQPVPSIAVLETRGLGLGLDEGRGMLAPDADATSWTCLAPNQVFFTGDNHLRFLEMYDVVASSMFVHEFSDQQSAETAAQQFADFYTTCTLLHNGDRVERAPVAADGDYAVWSSLRFKDGQPTFIGEHFWAVLRRGNLVIRLLVPSLDDLPGVIEALGLG